MSGDVGLVLGVIALLLVLLAIRMPVAFALGLSGAVGLLLLRDFSFITNTLASSPFDNTNKFTFTIIPMFILMGMLAVKARVAEQVYAVAGQAFRKLPGSLGVSTVAACAGFAAVSGSSIGTAATMSKLSVAEMRKHGYPISLAAATVAVAGTLGVLIPPSVILVLYAIMTGESVARVLAAGIIPGILSTIAYAAYLMWAYPASQRKARRRAQSLGQELENASINRIPLRELPLRGVVRVALLFLIVLGGMYSGLFTPTESAAVGALAAMLMLVHEMWKEGPRAVISSIVSALKETAGTTSMVFAIIIGSGILSTFFVVAKVPRMLTDAVIGLGWNGHLTMALLLLMLIPLGMALESISILVITVPLLYPIATEFGFDGVWLAILIVKLIEIGMVTPPVGINCFVVAGTARVDVTQIFRGVLPFVLIDIVLIAILFIFPQITLYLPSLVEF